SRLLDQLDGIFNRDVRLASEEFVRLGDALCNLCHGAQPFTSMPQDCADPRMIFIAASTEFAFRSFILVSAILRSWAAVIEPATSRPGFVEPLARERLPTAGRPAACLIRNEAGAVFSSRLKDLSW